MVSAQGFEPRTHALEGRCSIQLSYAPTFLFGAGDRTRTYNLLITSQLLYQLSHTSIVYYLIKEIGDLDGVRTHDLQRDRLAF